MVLHPGVLRLEVVRHFGVIFGLWVYNLGCDDQVSYIQGYYNKGSYVKGSYDQGKECITINWDIYVGKKVNFRYLHDNLRSVPKVLSCPFLRV